MRSNLPSNLFPQPLVFTSLGHTTWGSTSHNICTLPSLVAEHVASTLRSHFTPRAVSQGKGLQVRNLVGHAGESVRKHCRLAGAAQYTDD